MPRADSHGYRPGLVDLKAGQISREVFVNEAIYQEELERVFARAWLFVGHESQIPQPGDFVVSGMGEESVILCRDRAGEVHVFLNSCRHRGMKVCRYDEGNTAVFTCPYHGCLPAPTTAGATAPTVGWLACRISARPITKGSTNRNGG
jgi:nitrite reductase/ring-hydroxylating ferredoxin subunit